MSHWCLATHHYWLQCNSSALRPEVRSKSAPQAPVTWYASTWGNQHRCRSANTSISTSLIILPWFWLSCSTFFYGTFVLWVTWEVKMGEMCWIPAWESCNSFYVYLNRLWGPCVLFSCWNPVLLLLLSETNQPRPRIGRSEDKLKSHRFLWPWHSAFPPF